MKTKNTNIVMTRNFSVETSRTILCYIRHSNGKYLCHDKNNNLQIKELQPGDKSFIFKENEYAGFERDLSSDLPNGKLVLLNAFTSNAADKQGHFIGYESNSKTVRLIKTKIKRKGWIIIENENHVLFESINHGQYRYFKLVSQNKTDNRYLASDGTNVLIKHVPLDSPVDTYRDIRFQIQETDLHDITGEDITHRYCSCFPLRWFKTKRYASSLQDNRTNFGMNTIDSSFIVSHKNV